MAVTDGGHGVAGVLEQIAALGIERALIHPHQRGLEARVTRRPGARAATIKSPRLMSISRSSTSVTESGATAFVEIAVPGDDALDLRAAAGGQHGDGVAGTHGAGSDLPRESAEGVIGPQHALHRKTERRSARVRERRGTASSSSSSEGPSYQGIGACGRDAPRCRL